MDEAAVVTSPAGRTRADQTVRTTAPGSGPRHRVGRPPPRARPPRTPTLVIHGDRAWYPAEGRPATAAAVPGAWLVTYPGMGHDLPRALWPSILGEISALAARSQPVPQEMR